MVRKHHSMREVKGKYGVPNVIYIGHQKALEEDKTLHDMTARPGDDVNLEWRRIVPKSRFKPENLKIRECSITMAVTRRHSTEHEWERFVKFLLRFGIRGMFSHEVGDKEGWGHGQGVAAVYATSSGAVKSQLIEYVWGDKGLYTMSCGKLPVLTDFHPIQAARSLSYISALLLLHPWCPYL